MAARHAITSAGLNKFTQDTFYLVDIEHQKAPVPVTCMGFAKSETGAFLVGSEHGSIYQVNRFDSALLKSGIDANIVYNGHNSVVTSIDFHRSHSDFQDLFLTSSFDWTVNLWRKGNHATKPLVSLEHYQDYVYDIKWAPKHPAMFATADGLGALEIHNLTRSDTLVERHVMPNNKPLNKLAWHDNHIACGSLDGTIFLHQVEKVIW